MSYIHIHHHKVISWRYLEDSERAKTSSYNNNLRERMPKRRREEDEEKETEGLSTFKARIDKRAREIVSDFFPQKIKAMQDLYLKFRQKQLEKHTSTQKRFDKIPSNEHVEVMYKTLKKEILEMVEFFSHLRLWLRLKVPRHSSGNNFRVKVIAEISQMLSSGRSSGLNVLEVVAKYFLRRAKYVSDAEKFPRSEDQARKVADLDEKQYICLIQGAMGLRNTFMLLLDKITKNFDSINEVDDKSGKRVSDIMVM